MEGKSQTPCQDSLKKAMQFGKILSKGIIQRDSLLSIRLQTIQILEKENTFIKKQKDSLLQENNKAIENNNKLIHKNKQVKKQRNILAIIVLIVASILLI